jgi:hypothetical protein
MSLVDDKLCKGTCPPTTLKTILQEDSNDISLFIWVKRMGKMLL